MKSIHACGALLTMSALCLTAAAQGTGNYGSSSLLPLPELNMKYPTARYPAVHPATHNRSAAEAWNTPSYQQSRVVGTGDSYPSTLSPPMQGPSQMPIGPKYPQHQVPQHPHGQHEHPHVQHGGKDFAGGCTSCGGLHASGSCSLGRKRRHGHGGGGVFRSLWHIEPRTSVYGARTGSGWFAGAGGLIMNRDSDDHYHFSFGDNAEHIQLLDVREADMDWSGGFEARFGHYFNCGQNAWEVVYWGIFPGQEESVLLNDDVNGSLNGILNFEDLSIDVGGVPVAVGDWINNADAHRVRRDFDFHNLELNIWNYSGCAAVGCRTRLQYSWGFGARYFKVSDELEFAAREAGAGNVFDSDTNQINYDVEVNNHLIGAQLIGNGQYFIHDRLSIIFGTKVGLYANVINQSSRIYNVDGVAYVDDGGPNDGLVWDISSDKTDVVMMAEINVGMNYQLNQCWSLYGGYRALGISSLATAPGQIPHDLRGVQDVQIIDSNDDMILHGGYFGVTFNW